MWKPLAMLESWGAYQTKSDEEFEDIANNSPRKVEGKWESTRETLAERGPPPLSISVPQAVCSVCGVCSFIPLTVWVCIDSEAFHQPISIRVCCPLLQFCFIIQDHLLPPGKGILIFCSGKETNWLLCTQPKKKRIEEGKKHDLRYIMHLFIMFCWQ